MTEKIKGALKYFWVVSTAVLALVLVVVLLTGNSPTISANAVGQKVVDFANNQGANAQLISVEKEGELYKVVVSIDNQQVPVFVTKDGRNLVPSVIPLEETSTTPSTTPSQTPTTTDIPKNDKPVVEAFVMSHCPYGTQIEKGLIPVVNY
jgi:hypothetical protein